MIGAGFEYLTYSDSPLTDENINYEQPDGSIIREKMTPMRKLTYLMVDLLDTTFSELEREQRKKNSAIEINPNTVFGYMKDGRRKYEYLAETVILTLETENDKNDGILKNLFTKPINFDGSKKYLNFDNDILTKDIKISLKTIIENENFKFPLNDSAYKEFSYHITECLKGMIYTDFVKAYAMQKANKTFYPSDFLTVKKEKKYGLQF